MRVALPALALALAVSTAIAAQTDPDDDVVTAGRAIWDLVRPSDALRAFLEHQAADAPGAVGVVVDSGSAAALSRIKEAIADLQATGGPFIFTTFHRTGVSEPRLMPTWQQLQQAVAAVSPPPEDTTEPRGVGPGPLDAVLGVAAVAPKGTRIILVTEAGAEGSDAEDAAVAGVARALKAGGIQLDAWALGSCNNFRALANVSRATRGSLGCGDVRTAAGLKEVTLALRRGMEEPLEVRVDSSVLAMQAVVNGRAALRAPSGRSWTLDPDDTGFATLSLDRHQLAAATGPWLLTPRPGSAPDAEVRAISQLAVPATLLQSDALGTLQRTADQSGKEKRIRLQQPQGVTISSVKLLDQSGKEVEPASRVSGYASKQVTRRAANQIELLAEDSEWNVKMMPGNSSLVETTGHNADGEVFTRVSNLTRVDNIYIILPPLDIEISTSTQLLARQGQNLQITYDITNNRDIGQLVRFRLQDVLGFLLWVRPYEIVIPPRQTMQVVGSLQVTQNAADGQRDRITLYASSSSERQEISKVALLYVQNEPLNDVDEPTISSHWKSTCSGAWDTATCNTNSWTIDFTIQDKDSGLLTVTSNPRGIQFREDFISGSRERVRAYYSASCCSKRLDIVAYDLRGNIRRENYDVGSQFLNAAEIAGITVGVIAIILIIVIIVLAVLLCKRRESLRIERRLSSRLASREGR